MKSTGKSTGSVGGTGSSKAATGSIGRTGVSSREETLEMKEQKVYEERCHEAQHKVQQTSEALLPRIAENLGKSHSGVQGSVIVIEALMERLDGTDDPECISTIGTAVPLLMVKGSEELVQWVSHQVYLPGRQPTRLARIKSLELLSGLPTVRNEALEVLKLKLSTLTASLQDNKDELVEKRAALRDAQEEAAKRDKRHDRLRAQVKDRVVSPEERIQGEIDVLKDNIKVIEDGSLAREVSEKEAKFLGGLAEKRSTNNTIAAALLHALRSDIDLICKEAAAAALATVVESNNEKVMTLMEDYLEGKGVIEPNPPDEQALPFVHKNYREQTQAVRARVLEILGQSALRGHPRGVDLAIKSLGMGGEEARASLSALRGLAYYGDGDIILSVLSKMESRDPKVRDLASKALLLVAEAGDEVAIEGCRNLLSHANPGVRISCLVAMGMMKLPHDSNRRIVLALSMCLGMERLHRVRIAALGELAFVARASDPLAVEAAGERVSDKDPSVRLKAIETLAIVSPPGTDRSQATTILLRHLEGGDMGVRRSAADALAAVCYGDGGTVYRLATLVRNHHDVSVRHIGFEALTMCSDPQALEQTTKFLEGIDPDLQESWSSFTKVSKVAGDAAAPQVGGGLSAVGNAPQLVTKTLVPSLRHASASMRWTNALVLGKVLTQFQPGKQKEEEEEDKKMSAAALAKKKKQEESKQGDDEEDENELFKGRSGVEVKRIVLMGLLDRFVDPDARVRHASVACLEIVCTMGGCEQVPAGKGAVTPLHSLIFERLRNPPVSGSTATADEVKETCIQALCAIEYNALSAEDLRQNPIATHAAKDKAGAATKPLVGTSAKEAKAKEASLAAKAKALKQGRATILATVQQQVAQSHPAVQCAALHGVALLAQRGSAEAIACVTPAMDSPYSAVRAEAVDACSRLAPECGCDAAQEACTCGTQGEMVKLATLLQDGESVVYQGAAKAIDQMLVEVRDKTIKLEVLLEIVAASLPHEYRHVVFDASGARPPTSKGQPPGRVGGPLESMDEDEEVGDGAGAAEDAPPAEEAAAPVTEEEWRASLLSAKRIIMLPLLVKIAERGGGGGAGKGPSQHKVPSIDALIRCLFDRNDDVRALVVQSLTQLVDAGDEVCLKGLLAEDDNVWPFEGPHLTWMKAISVLSSPNDKRVVTSLCGRIGASSGGAPGEEGGGEEAAEGEGRDTGAAPFTRALSGGEDGKGGDLWVVRKTAADCLGTVATRGNMFAIELVQPHLSNPVSSIRNAALRAMASLSVLPNTAGPAGSRPGTSESSGGSRPVSRGAYADVFGDDDEGFQIDAAQFESNLNNATGGVETSVVATNVRNLAHGVGMGGGGMDIQAYELLQSAANAPQAVTRRAALETLSVLCASGQPARDANKGPGGEEEEAPKSQLVVKAINVGMRCLSDRDVSVRQRAVKLLFSVAEGDNKVVVRLMKIAQDADRKFGHASSPEGRQFAIKAIAAIAKIGDEEVCDMLVDLIDDDERLVRQSCAEGLQRVTAPDDLDTVAMLLEIRDRPDKEWEQRGELVKEIKTSVTGVLQRLAVHWVPAEIRHKGVEGLMGFMRQAYQEELECRRQDELEEGVEEEIAEGQTKQQKAVASLADGRYEDAKHECRVARQAYKEALRMHRLAEEGVQSSSTLMEEHAIMTDQIEGLLVALRGMAQDIENRRGGINRREVIDRKIRAEAQADEEEHNPYDVEGWTRLHYAAQWGLVERIEGLLALGAEVNCTVSKGPYVGRTPHDLAKDERTKQCLHSHGGVAGFQLKHLLKKAPEAEREPTEEEKAAEIKAAIEEASHVKRNSNKARGRKGDSPSRRKGEVRAGYPGDRPASASMRKPKRLVNSAEVPLQFMNETGGLRGDRPRKGGRKGAKKKKQAEGAP